MFRGLLYTVGLTLSAIAAYYSVTGLAYVFSGAYVPVLIMGAGLEAAKLVGASWVFRSWRTAPRLLTAYVTTGVFALMLLTGLGIFGFLSRAYLVQQAPVAAMTTELAAADRAVALAQEQYDRDVAALQSAQDSQSATGVIDRLAANDRLTGTNGAVNVLRQQQQIRQTLQTSVTAAATALRDAETARATLQQSFAEQTVDVGPLMFVADAWYGSSDLDTMNRAVRWLIVLIMSAFDPMAIALLLAAQHRTQSTARTAIPVSAPPVPPAEPPAPRPSTPAPSARTSPPSSRTPMPDPFDTPTAAEFSAANIEPALEVDVTTPDAAVTPAPTPAPASSRLRWKIGRRRTRTAPKH